MKMLIVTGTKGCISGSSVIGMMNASTVPHAVMIAAQACRPAVLDARGAPSF
jgi:hypothetical protein